MAEMKKIPLILDGDPGHDDAIAWVLAHGCGCFDIRAVVAVGGNQTIEKTGYNARRICTLIGLDAPVAEGCHQPLLTPRMNAPTIHGESGLDGPALPEPTMEFSELDGISLMAKVLRESEEPVTIVSSGPLTDTAMLLLSYPELKSKIARVSLMGGGIHHGNWTPPAEFNILVDPEAADVVFKSGVPLIMSGLDVTEKALVTPADFERVRALGNPVSEIVWQWLEFFYRFHKTIGYPGAPLHDPCAVMVLLHPEIFTIEDYYIQVETRGDYCKGMTLADFYGFSGHKPNAACVVDLDREKFLDYLVEAIANYGEVKA